MRKPLLLGSVSVRPITGSDLSRFCMACLKSEARWLVGRGGPHDYVSCASCFLYRSPWGKANSNGIAELVFSTERELGMCISSDGVVLDEHADRIVSAVVLTTTFARSKRG